VGDLQGNVRRIVDFAVVRGRARRRRSRHDGSERCLGYPPEDLLACGSSFYELCERALTRLAAESDAVCAICTCWSVTLWLCEGRQFPTPLNVLRQGVVLAPTASTSAQLRLRDVFDELRVLHSPPEQIPSFLVSSEAHALLREICGDTLVSYAHRVFPGGRSRRWCWCTYGSPFHLAACPRLDVIAPARERPWPGAWSYTPPPGRTARTDWCSGRSPVLSWNGAGRRWQAIAPQFEEHLPAVRLSTRCASAQSAPAGVPRCAVVRRADSWVFAITLADYFPGGIRRVL